MQIARHHYGAVVTGVCSTRNLDLVRSLGANDVIDYTAEDFTARGVQYDVVLDAVAKLPPGRAKAALKPGGVYLNAHKHSGNSERLDDLLLLAEWIEAGKVKPYIDRSYPLEAIVEAHRYVDTGRKRGNVVITIA